MKKKILLLLASLALVTTLAVNGTFATELGNIFKVLENAIQGLVSSPESNAEQFKVTVVSSSDKVLAPSHYIGEFPENIDDANGVVKNTTYVLNEKSKDAYVRICIYVKDCDEKVLRYAIPTAVVEADFTTVSVVDGNGYTLYNFDYKNVLPGVRTENPAPITSPITMKVALTKETTNEDIQNLGSDFIKVQAFAIAAESFQNIDKDGNTITGEGTKATPHEALELTLGEISKFDPFKK